MKEMKVSKDIVLRHVKLSDAQIFFEIELDKDNIKNMMSYTKNIEGVRKSIKKNILEYKKKKPSSETFAIEVEGDVAGSIEIHGLNVPYIEHKAQISYSLHPKFRGKGITTMALKLITSYAFKKYNLKRIESRCRSFNKASARVLKKAGYVLEGIHKKDLKKDGKYLDNMYWAKVK